MKRHYEQLLVATLVGIVITAAAAFFVSPVEAGGDRSESWTGGQSSIIWDGSNLKASSDVSR